MIGTMPRYYFATGKRGGHLNKSELTEEELAEKDLALRWQQSPEKKALEESIRNTSRPIKWKKYLF